MTLRSVIKNLTPHGIVQFYWRRDHARELEAYRRRMAERDARRAAAAPQLARETARSFDYGEALSFLDSLKIAPFHVRDGSMPLPSLEFMQRQFDRLDAADPLLGLHVGNFLGVSLSYLTNALSKRHSESRVISIDPNIPHRGIVRPAEAVIALLAEFGLEDRVAILQGYSLEKSVSNDGEVFEGYDPVTNWRSERACTEQLALLNVLCPGRFDVCLIDGNHDATYLRRELDQVQQLLVPGGLLVLDDVADPWPEIQSVFAEIATERFEKIGTDGRIAVLVKR